MREKLRRDVRSNQITPLIGVFDMFSASLAAQHYGGIKSPRLSLTELEDLGVNVAIYSTPCLFAAQTAIENALLELRANDGRLPEVKDGDVGVTASTELLERNISHEPNPRRA